jgi:hypothetical protein
MRAQILIYGMLALLLLVGVGPAAAETCSPDSSSKCCCVEVEKFEVCTPQLCADVKSPADKAHSILPVFDYSVVVLQVCSADLVDEPFAKPQRSLTPTVKRERAPPPLFADLTLCFLPPPV